MANGHTKKTTISLLRKIHRNYITNIKHVLQITGFGYTFDGNEPPINQSVDQLAGDLSTHLFETSYLKKFKTILFVFGLALLAGCGQVGTGERGMKVTFGEVVSSKPLDEGLYFFLPMTTSLVTYNVKEQIVGVETIAFTKDIQKITLNMVVNFRVLEGEVINLHKNVGKDYIKIAITPKIPDIAKNVIGKWEADEIVSKREEATSLITQQLRDAVKKNGIEIVVVNMTNIDFQDSFEEAVEAKQIAAQNAIKAKNETERVQEEARQKLITAKAEAEAMEVRAQALTKNKSLVEYEAVQRWNGQLPVYMMGDAVPFMNINP